jgi:hypothetical protein
MNYFRIEKHGGLGAWYMNRETKTGPQVHHGLGPMMAPKLARDHAPGWLRQRKLTTTALKQREEQGGSHHGHKAVVET